jgi:hypothetical protein
MAPHRVRKTGSLRYYHLRYADWKQTSLRARTFAAYVGPREIRMELCASDSTAVQYRYHPITETLIEWA